MDRRSFLKLFGAAPLVIAAPSLAEIWIPPQQKIIVPPEIKDTIVKGNTICGWVVPMKMAGDVYDMLNDYEAPQMRQQFAADAFSYFPPKTPILLLAGNVLFERKRVYSLQPIMRRFSWTGTTSMPENGNKYRILQNWDDSSRMVLQ